MFFIVRVTVAERHILYRYSIARKSNLKELNAGHMYLQKAIVEHCFLKSSFFTPQRQLCFQLFQRRDEHWTFKENIQYSYTHKTCAMQIGRNMDRLTDIVRDFFHTNVWSIQIFLLHSKKLNSS